MPFFFMFIRSFNDATLNQQIVGQDAVIRSLLGPSLIIIVLIISILKFGQPVADERKRELLQTPVIVLDNVAHFHEAGNSEQDHGEDDYDHLDRVVTGHKTLTGILLFSTL